MDEHTLYDDDSTPAAESNGAVNAVDVAGDSNDPFGAFDTTVCGLFRCRGGGESKGGFAGALIVSFITDKVRNNLWVLGVYIDVNLFKLLTGKLFILVIISDFRLCLSDFLFILS